MIQEDETIKIILKKIGQKDIKEFAENNRFLLFQERIYVPISLRKEIIIKQYKLPIYKH